MKYLLDTNAVIGLLGDSRSRLAKAVRRRKPNDIGISAIVVHELYYGAFKSHRATENVAVVDSLQFEVFAFTQEDARCAGEVRAALASRGTPIGPLDTLIAGQALSRNWILVTHNGREFGRIPGLRFEDWE